MSAVDPSPLSSAQLDLLFRRWGDRLPRLVASAVSAPTPLIEDACQSAWVRLALVPGVSGDHTLGWLATTALREARRMARHADREVSFDQLIDTRGEPDLSRLVGEGPHDGVVEQLRVQAMGQLTRRQQRLIWLQALGCSHAEIAALSGCTRRTIHRQLVRARARLRAADRG